MARTLLSTRLLCRPCVLGGAQPYPLRAGDFSIGKVQTPECRVCLGLHGVELMTAVQRANGNILLGRDKPALQKSRSFGFAVFREESEHRCFDRSADNPAT